MITQAIRHVSATVFPLLLALLLAVISFSGCGGPPEEPPAPTIERIHNERLDITASLESDVWTLVENSGDLLRFGPTVEGAGGTATASVGPIETGVNLVEAVKTHQAGIEGKPGGSYAGAQELSGPLGTAFYSRGRYEDGETTMEETCIFGLHPRARRRLDLCYSYPAGDDSAARVQTLIELFATLG